MGNKVGGVEQFTVLTLAAAGAGTTNYPFDMSYCDMATFVLELTAGGGAMTLDLALQMFDIAANDWVTIASFPQKTVANTDFLILGAYHHDSSLSAARRYAHPPVPNMRAQVVIGGASPSYTGTLSCHKRQTYQ